MQKDKILCWKLDCPTVVFWFRDVREYSATQLVERIKFKLSHAICKEKSEGRGLRDDKEEV